MLRTWVILYKTAEIHRRWCVLVLSSIVFYLDIELLLLLWFIALTLTNQAGLLVNKWILNRKSKTIPSTLDLLVYLEDFFVVALEYMQVRILGLTLFLILDNFSIRMLFLCIIENARDFLILHYHLFASLASI